MELLAVYYISSIIQIKTLLFPPEPVVLHPTQTKIYRMHTDSK